MTTQPTGGLKPCFTIERGVHRRYAVFVREGERITDIVEADKAFMRHYVNGLLRKGLTFVRASQEQPHG